MATTTDPIFFLHGLRGAPRGKKPRALRDAGYEVVAPDFRWRSTDRRLRKLEGVTAGKHNLVVVGSSLGGMMALLLAQKHPRRVGGLVLCAPALTQSTISLINHVPANTVIIHGVHDEVIPVDLARRLAADHGVKLVEVADRHRLRKSLDVIRTAVDVVVAEAGGRARDRVGSSF